MSYTSQKSFSVKVCGMRHAQNLEEIAQLPIDWMGFIFYPKSPRYAEGVLEKKTLNLIPPHVKKVGVFVDNELDSTLEILRNYSLHFAQLHGKESPSYCEEIRKAGFGVIKVFSVDDHVDFTEVIPYENVVDFFLFDTKSPQHGGTGQKFNWDVLGKYKSNVPVFLSGGIDPNDVALLKNVMLQYPWIVGIDLNSKFEVSPGLKDKEKLRTFITALHA